MTIAGTRACPRNVLCPPLLGQLRAVPWTRDQGLKSTVTRLRQLPGLRTYRTSLGHKERLDGGFVNFSAYARPLGTRRRDVHGRYELGREYPWAVQPKQPSTRAWLLVKGKKYNLFQQYPSRRDMGLSVPCHLLGGQMTSPNGVSNAISSCAWLRIGIL